MDDPKIGRGIRPRPTRTRPCGTYAAAQRHLRDGIAREDLDPKCAAALRAYQADAARRTRERRRA